MSSEFTNRIASLTKPENQLRIINWESGISLFDEKLSETGLHPLSAKGIEVFQVNVGKLCNQTCKHCHVDAGPKRTEIMTKETMQCCLTALENTDIPTVDITGGAPEMNPHFKWFVTEIKNRQRHVIVRSNLTILLNEPFEDFPEFFKQHQVEVVSSLPYFLAENTDAQRGRGVFDKSIAALKRLNGLGYGQPDGDLKLNLVYNPVGAFLPPSQAAIEADYKRELKSRYGVVFNNLYTITNMPISRFLAFLIRSNNYTRYMHKLHASYNPTAASNVMCRTMLSVSWDGLLYDCDFNQMLNLTVNHGVPTHINNFDLSMLAHRRIVTGQHCYGCTAGSGSSCAGTIA
ncbi:MAG: arsenosugar biosynthesis radical SAM (seleno)protein ArsS [bacterium]